MIGRIPIIDVQPVVRVPGINGPKSPAKAVPGESFPVTATVIREGHEMLGPASCSLTLMAAGNRWSGCAS